VIGRSATDTSPLAEDRDAAARLTDGRRLAIPVNRAGYFPDILPPFGGFNRSRPRSRPEDMTPPSSG
jgi:hypothetical protein